MFFWKLIKSIRLVRLYANSFWLLVVLGIFYMENVNAFKEVVWDAKGVDFQVTATERQLIRQLAGQFMAELDEGDQGILKYITNSRDPESAIYIGVPITTYENILDTRDPNTGFFLQRVFNHLGFLNDVNSIRYADDFFEASQGNPKDRISIKQEQLKAMKPATGSALDAYQEQQNGNTQFGLMYAQSIANIPGYFRLQTLAAQKALENIIRHEAEFAGVESKRKFHFVIPLHLPEIKKAYNAKTQKLNENTVYLTSENAVKMIKELTLHHSKLLASQSRPDNVSWDVRIHILMPGVPKKAADRTIEVLGYLLNQSGLYEEKPFSLKVGEHGVFFCEVEEFEEKVCRKITLGDGSTEEIVGHRSGRRTRAAVANAAGDNNSLSLDDVPSLLRSAIGNNSRAGILGSRAGILGSRAGILGSRAGILGSRAGTTLGLTGPRPRPEGSDTPSTSGSVLPVSSSEERAIVPQSNQGSTSMVPASTELGDDSGKIIPSLPHVPFELGRSGRAEVKGTFSKRFARMSMKEDESGISEESVSDRIEGAYGFDGSNTYVEVERETTHQKSERRRAPLIKGTLGAPRSITSLK